MGNDVASTGWVSAILTLPPAAGNSGTLSKKNVTMLEQSPPAPPVANQQVEFSIIMPCLNEAETLEVCVRKALAFLEKHHISGEVVVGDNGSTDGSQDIARRCGARVVNVPVRGYGAALYYATLGCRGRYAIMGDSDDSYDFTDLMPFIEKLRQGYDLVMGNRFLGGIKPGAMPWKNRYIGNPILSSIGRLLFHCPAKDFHCGLRGYSIEGFAKMDLQTTGMEYASEMVIKSTLLGLKIAEVPTTLSPDGRSRPPHLRPWRDGWRHLRFMLLFSPRWLFLVPGLLLILLGSAMGALLLGGPVTVFSLRLDVHSLLYCAAAVEIGFQAIAFAVFAKVYAISNGLLPADPRLSRLFRIITLEVGVVCGLVLLMLGLAGSVAALFWWRSTGYGALDVDRVLRLVIPSIFAITLGFEITLSSFFLSVLGLGTRRDERDRRP
jgi:glycosyltransferase involved in cell wall biosynthesis